MSDLSRLDPYSFERLIRALAFQVFGPGGVVFSSGPDAGRDFSFNGKIRGYEPQNWHGSLVLQAKFKDPLTNYDEIDGIKWLISTLDAEKSKFLDANKGLKVPEYYIVATNVRLSGADGKGKGGAVRSGGYTKVGKHLDTWITDLGIKGYDIWPADKINDLLATHSEVRQSFAAWVTSGDVLSAALEYFNDNTPSFSGVIKKVLKRELKKDQYARLKDAGSVENEEIPTDRVFVDLPVKTERPVRSRGTNALAEIVKLSRGTFDFDDDVPPSSKKVSTGPNRIVLLGGPGQGKSTLTTYLSQLFRAQIISDDPAYDRDPALATLVPNIMNRAESEGVARDIPRRYPVSISLPRFADFISARSNEGHSPSLLEYISDKFGKLADEDVSKKQLRQWLKIYPWIVVLDGLDEVPSSGERSAVLESIRAFESEVLEVNGDVLFVLTTRPQGYNKEFDPAVWQHWHLQDLRVDEALRYAEELGKALHRDDPERRGDIIEALRAASKSAATSRLMANPLQVTIMHMIVDTGGGVPPGRWSLFNEYYEVLKRREKAKNSHIRLAIERNLQFLNPLHQRVGLALHIESERAGGANAYLTPQQFETLVREYLRSESQPDDEIVARATELRELATNRLVLLSAKETDRITFDVRSLQEFMCAAAITAGGHEHLEKRLMHIAPLIHWRNVFLIAASRCFNDDAFHHLRAVVTNIPRLLETESTYAFLKSGAKLSLDMFVDGVSTENPQYRRQLAAHCLDLLEHGVAELDERLATVVEDATRDLVLVRLQCEIHNSTKSSSAVAAWALSVALGSEKDEIFWNLGVNNVPGDSPFFVDSLPKVQRYLSSAELALVVRQVLLGKTVEETFNAFGRIGRGLGVKDDNPLYDLISNLQWPDDFATNAGDFGIWNYCAIANNRSAHQISQISDDSEWQLFNKLLEFNMGPSAIAAAAFLRWVAKSDNVEVAREFLFWAPWPLGSLLALISDDFPISDLINRVENLAYGDIEDWTNGEERFGKGLKPRDFEYATKTGEPYGTEVSVVGIPIGYPSIRHHDVATCAHFGAWLGNLPEGGFKGALRDNFRYALFQQIAWVDDPDDLTGILDAISNLGGIPIPPSFFFRLSKDAMSPAVNMDRLLDLALRCDINPSEVVDEEIPTDLVDVYLSDIEKYANFIIPIIMNPHMYKLIERSLTPPPKSSESVSYEFARALKDTLARIRSAESLCSDFVDFTNTLIKLLLDGSSLDAIELDTAINIIVCLNDQAVIENGMNNDATRVPLQTLMNRRPSHLEDATRWQNLGLPPDLLGSSLLSRNLASARSKM
ncbi:hypothetical protein G6M70_23890 [Agrobacterium tumefaciens]|uniref:NACHT domain-containing protein n=1 Tax=Agrobacterium tumefaciens TaxID=358 RepID=UPI001572A919|nr:hypothetical protein [Agrobacterium tumefaciens]NSY99781.1 hypothetical protein [Agrobacterium tumefaciens]NSZ37929.1 hypothetical protein [Agrobacterium tumefaciens]NTB24230.1 hypothetical protein [Agrobacterium tumefaciens]NTB30559.1 hypothetical protein [Agrobacterium tumefaciens]NTB37138.1 hypothetical protein [Agrobacterium tumefaciens]